MSDSAGPASAAPAPGTRAPLSGIDIAAFACELFAFISLAIWGFAMWPFPWNIVAGLGAPALAIVVWALFVSPRAVFAVHPFVRAFVELLVYASATIACPAVATAVFFPAFTVTLPSCTNTIGSESSLNVEIANFVPVAMKCMRRATTRKGSSIPGFTSNAAVPSTFTTRLD